jgi:hypothetical protein
MLGFVKATNVAIIAQRFKRPPPPISPVFDSVTYLGRKIAVLIQDLILTPNSEARSLCVLISPVCSEYKSYFNF